jgi:hypothetical protein
MQVILLPGFEPQLSTPQLFYVLVCFGRLACVCVCGGGGAG